MDAPASILDGPLDRLQRTFRWFEILLSIVVSLLLAAILLVIVARLVVTAYLSVFAKIAHPTAIVSESFTDIFAKIITLLITVEFLNSIMRVVKGGELKKLVNDVMLLSGLAIGRKLIVIDYAQTEPLLVLIIAGALVSLGVFYFLVQYEGRASGAAGRKASPTADAPRTRAATIPGMAEGHPAAGGRSLRARPGSGAAPAAGEPAGRQ